MSKLEIRNNTNLTYPVKYDSQANSKNVIDIWIKFAKQLKPEEIYFLNDLNNKNLGSLSSTDIDKYNRIKKQLEMPELLLKYKNKNCTKEEYNLVSKLMDTPLSIFVESKMSIEEQESARKLIDDLFEKDKLQDYIESKEKVYDELDTYEAYVLFNAKEKMYDEEQRKLNKKIRDDQINRRLRLEASLDKYLKSN